MGQLETDHCYESTALHCDVDKPSRHLSFTGSGADFVMGRFV